MEDLTTCKLCFQTYEEPVLLQCNHPMCLKCAQRQFSFEVLRKPFLNFPLKTKHRIEKIKGHDDKQKVEITCPLCTAKTSLLVTQGVKLPKDIQLMEKIEESKKPKNKMCSANCGTIAILYCENCEEDYCQACFQKSHVTPRQKNHKTTSIANKPSVKPSNNCPNHGHPLAMFCQKDQVACCFECFQFGDHKGHQSSYVNEVVERVKKEVDAELAKVNKQIDQLKQTSSGMGMLRGCVTQLHEEFETNVRESLNEIIKRIEGKRDALLAESKAMKETTLSNILLQEAALTDLLNQKTEMVEEVSRRMKKDDLSVIKCKELLQRNQDTIASMLICCESGKLSTHVDVSPVKQLIDKLASICKVPIDLKLPAVTGLKESKQDENSVTVQWGPVKCDIATVYYVVQTTADNNDATAKNFKMPSDVTSLQAPVEKDWKQLVCTVYCAIDDQLVGPKCSPLSIKLIGNAQNILLHVKEKCSQQVYRQVQSVFNQKGTRLDLGNCNMGDSGAIAVAKMLPHLKQLQQLHIHYNQIGDAGAIAVAKMLPHLKQLQQLVIYNNQIGDTGATAIADGIKQLTQLQQLYIYNNQIGDTGATAIANGIKQLTQLQLLYIHNNQIGDAGATAIANAVGQLTKMKYLNIQNNNISAGVRDQLKKSAKFSQFYI